MRASIVLTVFIFSVVLSFSCGKSRVNNNKSEIKQKTELIADDWDKVLDSFEEYTDQYIKLMKKALEGDMSVVTEYGSMMEKATELSEKLESAESRLSDDQLNRFTKIQTKLLNAISDFGN